VAVSRVAQRVMQGGQNIPEDVIRRRFKAGLESFHKNCSKVVDLWALYNSYVYPPKLMQGKRVASFASVIFASRSMKLTSFASLLPDIF